MAKLTGTLSTPDRGMETQAPVKPGPSIFEGILSVADVITSGQEGARQTNMRRAAAARQAEQDRIEAEKRNANNDAVEGLLRIGSQGPMEVTTVQTGNLPPPVSSSLEGVGPEGVAAVKDAATSGRQIQRLETAMTQGRLSRAAYEVQVESLMRTLFSRYPGAKAEVFETLNKYAINHPIMSEYRQAAKVEEDRSTAQEKRDEEFIGIAEENGYVSGSREDKIVKGIQIRQADLQLERTMKQSQEARAQAQFNQGQIDRAEEARSDGLAVWIESKLTPDLNDWVNQLTEFANNQQMPVEQRMKELLPVVAQFQNKGRQRIDQIILEAQTHGMKREEAEAARTRMYSLLDQAVQPFDANNPANIMAVQANTLKIMKDRAGLRAEEALPLFSQMRQMFGNLGDESLQGFVDTVFANPKVASALTKEMRGFQGLGDGQQTVRLKNALAIILDENTQLRDLNPEDAAVALVQAKSFLDKTFPAAISGTNARAEELALNTIGKIANVGVDQTAGSSLGALVTASQYIADDKTYKLLRQASRRPENKEMAGLVADAARVAIQKNVIALKDKPTGDPYYRIIYDIGAQKFIIRPTGKKPQFDASNMDLSGGMNPRATGGARMPQPSIQVRNAVNSLNRNMKFLMATTDFDDGKLSQATAAERAKFYATGQYPASIKSDEKSKVPSSSELISKLGKYWDDVQIDWSAQDEFDPNTVVERRMGSVTPEAREAHSFFTGKGWSHEQAAGIVGNLQAEAGDDFSKRLEGGDGGKAVGVAQWHPDRQAKFEEVMGKPVRSASLREQLEFVDWELKNTEINAGNRLKKAKTASEAAHIVDEYYERSSGAHRGRRVGNALNLAEDNRG